MSYNRRHNAATQDDLHPVEVTRHYRALPGLRRRNAADRNKLPMKKYKVTEAGEYLASFDTYDEARNYCGKLIRGDWALERDLKINGKSIIWEFGNPREAKRNAAERDADHPIEVTKHYRSGPPGYMSPWQRAAGMGQNELFSTGIKLSTRAAEMRSKRNPGVTKAAYRSGLKEATAAQLGKLARIGLRTGHTVTDIKADLKATGRFTAEQIARGIEQARAAEKRQNPRRGTRRYMGSASLTASARSFESPRVLLLRDLIEAGEATPREISEYHRLIDQFNRRAFDVVETRHAKRHNPLTVKAKDFQSMRGQVEEGTKILFRDGDIGVIKSTAHGWVVKIYGRSVTRATTDINLLRLQIAAIDENKIANPRQTSKGKQKTKQLYEKFSGKRARRENSVTAPTGTPANVAKLGTLRLIETADGRKWKFRGAGAPILAADHRHKLHVVGGAYRMNPTGAECGEIVRVEYETDKPHLGQTTPAIYFHELGEETGERPTLRIDGDGLMHIDGGAYSIEADGIHN